MTDREQIRRDAEAIGDSPESFRLHGFARDVLALLAELERALADLHRCRHDFHTKVNSLQAQLEQTKRERDEARKALPDE